MLIASVRHPADCRCHHCTDRYPPRVAAGIILTLALAGWAVIIAAVIALT
jgi:hypothetical protein